MDFRISDNLDDERILSFILTDERSTIYHHPAWLKALSCALKLKARYLVVINQNKITGLIPFIVQKDIFISLPFTTHCNPLMPQEFNISELERIIKQTLPGIKGIRIKFRESSQLSTDNIEHRYYNHVIYISNNLDEYYESLGRRSIRRFIKKSYENNLRLRYGSTEDDLKIFYSLECKLRKSIGLPPAPYKFFLSLFKNLVAENLLLLPIVEKNQTPVASSVVLQFKDQLYFEYTAFDKKYINLYPNHFLHWEIIKKAYNEFGSRVIDLGRTDKDQSGLIFFKENWNAKRIKLLSYNQNAKQINRRGKIFSFIKKVNKQLPIIILKTEGKLLFSKFE